MILDCGGKPLDLAKPRVMGILNVTPDSFSDGGRFIRATDAVARARRMAEEGAAIIDIGGESTRPGARPVGVQEEIDRVIPVIEALATELAVPLSVDTSKPEVMIEAVRAGAGLINDVRALQDEGAPEAAAKCGVPVCLMHMQGEPRTMQDNPRYRDVVEEVLGFLAERMAACESVGIGRDRLLLDPGFGFGKSLEHNYSLLKHLGRFRELGAPLLVGMSRKRMIATVLDDAPVEERVYGGLAAATLAAWLGASVIRVHDVKPTVDALRVCSVALSAP